MPDKTLKLLLVLCCTVLLGGGANACGSSSKDAASSTAHTTAGNTTALENAAPPPPSDRDEDSDSNSKGRYDSDDTSVLSFGHAASPLEKTQITALVQRYYTAAAAQNGAEACSLLYSTYAEATPEDYGTHPPGPAYAHGTTCPQVLTAIFKHFHAQITAKLPKLKVIHVRTRAHQGIVVLSFGTMPETEMHVLREGHTWKMLALIDTKLP